jgi:hypothetical protein
MATKLDSSISFFFVRGENMYQMTSNKVKKTYVRVGKKLNVRTFVPRPLSALDMIKKDKLIVHWSETPMEIPKVEKVKVNIPIQKPKYPTLGVGVEDSVVQMPTQKVAPSKEQIFELCCKRITWNTVGDAIEHGHRVAKPIAQYIVGINVFNSLDPDFQAVLIEKVQKISLENKLGLCMF